jgi:hypothetical protein
MTTNTSLLTKIMDVGHFKITPEEIAAKNLKKIIVETNNGLYRVEYYVDSDGKKNGPQMSFVNSNNHMYNISYYKDDYLNGFNITINENYITCLREYSNGVLHGKYISWEMDGRISKYTIYENNEANGPSFQWNEDGSLASEVEYKHNKMDGFIKIFYMNSLEKYEHYSYADDGKTTRHMYDPVKDQEAWATAKITTFPDSLYQIWNQNFTPYNHEEAESDYDYETVTIPLNRKRSYVEISDDEDTKLLTKEELPPTPKRIKNVAAIGGSPGNSRVVSGF